MDKTTAARQAQEKLLQIKQRKNAPIFAPLFSPHPITDSLPLHHHDRDGRPQPSRLRQRARSYAERHDQDIEEITAILSLALVEIARNEPQIMAQSYGYILNRAQWQVMDQDQRDRYRQTNFPIFSIDDPTRTHDGTPLVETLQDENATLELELTYIKADTMDALKTLPTPERCAAVLKWIVDLDRADIARQMGITDEQTKYLLKKAKKQLRESMEKTQDAEPPHPPACTCRLCTKQRTPAPQDPRARRMPPLTPRPDPNANAWITVYYSPADLADIETIQDNATIRQ